MFKLNFKDTMKRMHTLIDNNPEDHLRTKKHWEEFVDNKKDQERLIVIKRSNLPPIKNLFESASAKNKHQEQFLNKLRAIDLTSNYRLPYVYGKPGSGKSYLATRFAYKLIYSGEWSVFFVCLSEFLIKFKDFSDTTKIDRLLDPHILIMDDFCSHNITNATVELLHAVIDHRLRNKKPTFITSNIPANKIAEVMYDSGKRSSVSEVMCEAIEDRIFDICTIDCLDSSSIRLEKALERIKNKNEEKP